MESRNLLNQRRIGSHKVVKRPYVQDVDHRVRRRLQDRHAQHRVIEDRHDHLLTVVTSDIDRHVHRRVIEDRHVPHHVTVTFVTEGRHVLRPVKVTEGHHVLHRVAVIAVLRRVTVTEDLPVHLRVTATIVIVRIGLHHSDIVTIGSDRHGLPRPVVLGEEPAQGSF